MTAVGVTCSRTIGRARNLCSTALAVAGFLAASAALFAFSLDYAEGLRLSLPVLWTLSVSPVLPFLCALLAMDSWSEERRTGRIEMLLSLPVREREFVIGKFFGLFFVSSAAVLLSLVFDIATLFFLAPSALEGAGIVAFLPAIAVLLLQSAFYRAAVIAVSSFFSNAMAAAVAAVAVVWALPRGVWQALIAWFPSGSEMFGEFPLDAHAADIAGGVIPVAAPVFYALFTVTALFIASKSLFLLRFAGRGAAARRASSVTVMLLALAVATLATTFVARLDATRDLSLADGGVSFSSRARDIFAETRGDVTVTCFVPRSDRRFRAVSHFLRAFAERSVSLGGSRLHIYYVDPRWDVGEAGRLARDGVAAPSIVFSNRRRRVAVPLDGGWDERACESALLRLFVPPARNAVYWTTGHGEAAFDDYGPAGMSDIARELARDGYRNFTLDLAGEAKIPSDCALIAIAGAKREFSRAEISRLDSYLKLSGRLLVLAEGGESALLTTLVPSWGALVKESAAKPKRTLSGTDLVVSDFGDHPVSAPLKGSQIVLEKPLLFVPSAAAGLSTGADRIDFSPLAVADSLAAAVMLERGAGAGDDTAIRPTRFALIGDAAFVRNAQLEARANANRDFFLNCVAYLSGSRVLTAGGVEAGLFTTGLDRRGRVRFLGVSAIALPGVVMAIMSFVAWKRRRRK